MCIAGLRCAFQCCSRSVPKAPPQRQQPLCFPVQLGAPPLPIEPSLCFSTSACLRGRLTHPATSTHSEVEVGLVSK